MIRIAKKPKILKLQIEVAELLRSHGKKIEYFRHHSGSYWHGVFEFEGVRYRVWFQLYVRRFGVDYVCIQREDQTVYKLELIELKKKLENIK